MIVITVTERLVRSLDGVGDLLLNLVELTLLDLDYLAKSDILPSYFQLRLPKIKYHQGPVHIWTLLDLNVSQRTAKS